MGNIFAMVVQSSIVGTVFIALILIVRWAMRNTTKLYVRMLWLLLLVELLVPPVLKSPFDSMRGILGRAEVPTSYEWMMQEPTDANPTDVNEGMQNAGALEEAEFHGEIAVTAGGKTAGNQKEIQEEKSWTKWLAPMSRPTFLFLVWLTGTVAMLFYYLEEFLRLHRRIKYAVRTVEGAWECDTIETPFVLPGLASKIYLPLGMSQEKRENIMAHEKQHIRCFDPWIKLVATLALAVHWFNPMVWIAYSLIGKDLEMFCDERVLRGKSLEEKKRYSQTLLDFAVEKRGISMTMQFGENGTGKRIEHILHAKKPRLVVSILLLVLVAGCGVFFLTSGSSNKMEYGSKEADLLDNVYVQAVRAAGGNQYAEDYISYTWEMDFDGNGSKEAFVAIGSETEGKLEGDIWFVNEKEAVLWKQAVYMESGQEYFKADEKAYLLLTCIDGNMVQTDVYGMPKSRSGAADADGGADKVPENMISYTGTKYLNEDGTIICNVGTIDGRYMVEDDSFSERTIKPYTFIYKNGAFVDIPGREVTEEEVKKLGNFGAITVLLESSGHDENERQYILRENGELQINLAGIYGDGIWFSYVTCSLGEDNVWKHVKRGGGFYRLSLDAETNIKEEKWLIQLKTEMGITDLEEKPVDMSENTARQSAVVGEVFTPDADLSSRIASVEDFSADWIGKIRKFHADEAAEEEGLADKVILVGRTDGFRIYGTNLLDTMIVETPDGKFVLSEENYITSNYEIQPRCSEADYDDDGETELAISTSVAHGTGIFVEYLFMVDRGDAGEWCMYQFMEEDYLAQLEPHFETVYRPEGVRLKVDGEEIGVISEIAQESLEQNYRYYAGAQICFEMNTIGESVQLQAELVGAENEMIYVGDYPGHEIDAEVVYQGTGKWKLENVRYADHNVNERIVNAIQSYFKGEYGDVQEYHVAEGYSLEDFDFQCEPMEVELYKIHYQNQKLDEGSVEAVATIRRGNDDSLDYLTVFLAAEEKIGMETVWKITDWYLEK